VAVGGSTAFLSVAVDGSTAFLSVAVRRLDRFSVGGGRRLDRFSVGGGRRLDPAGRPSFGGGRRLGLSADGGGLRLVLAGVAFGLAAAVKVTALAAAPFAVPLLLATWSEDRPRAAAWSAGPPCFGAVISATYAALALVTGYGIGFVHALGSTSDLVQWLSLPTGVGMAVGYVLRAAGAPGLYADAVAIARDLGYFCLAAILVGLWWWSVRRARDAAGVVTAAGLALLAVAVLGPVFYAWYAISGLAVLAVSTAGRPGALAVDGTPPPATTGPDHGEPGGAGSDRAGSDGAGVPGSVRGLSRALAIAAAGLIFLTLPDSLGLATKTKLPGAFLDVAMLVFLLVKLRRRGQAALRAGR